MNKNRNITLVLQYTYTGNIQIVYLHAGGLDIQEIPRVHDFIHNDTYKTFYHFVKIFKLSCMINRLV